MCLSIGLRDKQLDQDCDGHDQLADHHRLDPGQALVYLFDDAFQTSDPDFVVCDVGRYDFSLPPCILPALYLEELPYLDQEDDCQDVVRGVHD